jgi:hypothetical protein
MPSTFFVDGVCMADGMKFLFIYLSKLFFFTGVPFAVVMAWTVVHQQQSSANPRSFCWLPYAQGAHLWILAGTMGFILIVTFIFYAMFSIPNV